MKLARSYLLALFFLPFAGTSQSVNGYWYGSAFISGEDGDQNSYMVELILTDNGRTVQGILNYYFLNIYRSVPISATFDRNQQVLTFTDIPFVYYGSTLQKDVDCYMNGRFSLVLARAGTTLSGQWKPNPEYKNICPPIQARLSLDKDQSISDSLTQAIKNWRSNERVWTAPVSSSNQVTQKQPTTAPEPNSIKDSVLSKESVASKPATPTAEKIETKRPASKNKPFAKIKQLFKSQKATAKTQTVQREPAAKKERGTSNKERKTSKESRAKKQHPADSSITRFDPVNRKIEVVKELELEIDSVRISLYDNGEIDGDSISVFLNQSRIVTNQLLSARAIQFKIPLDSLTEFVEIIMVAENLGAIPPNTAIMVVEAGEKIYQILLSSSFEKSASVRIKRKRTGLKIR